ncbi:MAG: hypothetical protein KA713_04520 [Chryseotalea sp. WA131a]|nr:MAG: hypothetical protein KA713_04520 [Chryseotalea sp. WA131a]
MKRFYTATFFIALWLQGAGQIDVPVDPSTGKARVVIPMWNASYGSLKLPVSLFYNGGGVKVEEIEGNAGVGWSLTAGGQISRELRGLPDDFEVSGDSRKGWLSSSYTNTFTISNEQANWNALNFFGSVRDSEPDIFTINAPGLSGQFVFDNNRQLRLIPYQDVKVDYTRIGTENRIVSFVVTNNTGTKYFFNEPETVQRRAVRNGTTAISAFVKDFKLYEVPVNFNSTWKLTSIQSPSGENIGLIYSLGSSTNTDIVTKKVRVATASGDLTHLYTITDNIQLRTLSSITSGPLSIVFKWSNKYIQSIEVVDGIYSLTKKFSFNYRDILQSNDFAGGPNFKRFLKEIKEEAGCSAFPSFRFEYYSVDFNTDRTSIPFRDKDKQDYWGYHNATSTSVVPLIYYNDSAPNGERYRISKLPGYTATTGGSDRSVNAFVVADGSLRRIYYPSGGYAQIDFEASDYNDNGTTLLGGGVRVKKVTISDNDTDATNDIVREYEYKLANGQSSGRFVYKPSFAYADGVTIVLTPDNLAPDDDLLFERATVLQAGKGKTVYEYSVPGVYPQQAIAGTDFAATLSQYARNGSPPIENLQNGYYTYPYPPNTNFDFERGLLSRVADFAEGASLPLQEKTITYKRLNTVPSYIQATRFNQFESNTYQFGQYTIIANVAKVVDEEKTIVYDPSNLNQGNESIVSYSYNVVHNMLSQVQTTNSDGVITRSKIRYARDFNAITNPDLGLVDTVLRAHNVTISRMNNASNFMHGFVVETFSTVQRPSGAETYASGGLTLFSNFSTSSRVLPARSLVYSGSPGFTESTVAVNGASQSFSYSNRYRPAMIFSHYDLSGNVLTVADKQRNVSSSHYGYGNSIPVVSIVNAKANEVCFSDFESNSTGHLSDYFNFVELTDAWSGKRCGKLNASTVIEKSGLFNGAIGGFYKFSCWAKATTAVNITIEARIFNGTSWQAFPITYPTASSGQWIYLERRIPMTGIPSTFSFRIGASGLLLVDQVALYPEKAEITSSTFEPINGKTSITDTRGNSVFYQYDELGRLKYTFDAKKNLVQLDEYKYLVSPAPSLKSNFAIAGNYKAGSSMTFTAPENCTATIHQWKVDDVVVGTNSPTLTYTFPTHCYYWVELRVTSPEGIEPSVSKYKLTINPMDLGVAIRASRETVTFCDLSGVTMTAVVTGQCASPGSSLSYGWSYKNCNSSTWVQVFNGGISPSYVFNYAGTIPQADYVCPQGSTTGWVEIRCQVSMVCNSTCFSATAVGESTFTVKYDGSNRKCQ